MTSVPESTQKLLNGSVFRSLLDKVGEHAVILGLVRESLPASLAEHCRDCLAHENRLVLFTDSPAWASQLRFYAPAILARIGALAEYEFREIQVRNLRLQAPAYKPKPIKLPSPEVARMVKASGPGAPSDELRQALERLGATIERYAWRK
ncbi:MAG TPA: DciA family protein [Methylococcaceae bacterium]|jgi:hypothetical protein|nr:DciA family protein [Methylococcaceae bacterium]